jgi:hypothetical protein
MATRNSPSIAGPSAPLHAGTVPPKADTWRSAGCMPAKPVARCCRCCLLGEALLSEDVPAGSCACYLLNPSCWDVISYGMAHSSGIIRHALSQWCALLLMTAALSRNVSSNRHGGNQPVSRISSRHCMLRHQVMLSIVVHSWRTNQMMQSIPALMLVRSAYEAPNWGLRATMATAHASRPCSSWLMPPVHCSCIGAGLWHQLSSASLMGPVSA